MVFVARASGPIGFLVGRSFAFFVDLFVTVACQGNYHFTADVVCQTPGACYLLWPRCR